MAEKAIQDLDDLVYTSAIKNPLVTKPIESKLPKDLKKGVVGLCN